MQSLADDYEDPTLLVGSDAEKELSRALKIMGASWVAKVFSSFTVGDCCLNFAPEGQRAVLVLPFVHWAKLS